MIGWTIGERVHYKSSARNGTHQSTILVPDLGGLTLESHGMGSGLTSKRIGAPFGPLVHSNILELENVTRHCDVTFFGGL
jgi:hypothetical protein